MRSKRRLAAFVIGLVVVLGLPAAALADHISITASVNAQLKERTAAGSWKVEVTWTATCVGAVGSPSFSGSLNVRDVETNELYYLGGVSSATGTATRLFGPRKHSYFIRPELSINCTETHGSGTLETQGDPILIPARNDNGNGGADGGGGGGGSGGSGGGDPTEPLTDGGCRFALQGTNGPDTLDGSGSGDVIFGYDAPDILRGKSGHDCLLGGRGNDKLEGDNGNDRLTAGSGNDNLLGGAGNDRLVGGSGKDVLSGGSGRNVYYAGGGNDLVKAVNGRRETVRCGSGKDVARVDRRDRVSGCERVIRAQ
jgi:Ca2+-binding RTX toxin-like protein